MSRSPGNKVHSRSDSRAWKLKDIFEALQDLNLEGQIADQEKEQVGLGSSCDVFRAKLSRNNKTVAVKRIRLFLLDDITFADNLGREVRLWSKLNHPNVLPLLGYFLEGSKALPNLVSEWMKNGTLIDYMKDRRFDVYEICSMLRGIASGLNYIHTIHSMIHSDVKGSNIFVSDGGRPLLADFGLSVSSSSTSLAATTYHGQMGSLRWMAKELHSNSPNDILEAPKHTKMTDMWAFGMVISELLAREIPYKSIADRRVSAAILAGLLPQEPDFRNIFNGLICRGLWAVGRDCWLDDPLKRPLASDVLRELKSFGPGLNRIVCQNTLANRPKPVLSSTRDPLEQDSVRELEELEYKMRNHKITIQDVTSETEHFTNNVPVIGSGFVVGESTAVKKGERRPSLSNRRGFYRVPSYMSPQNTGLQPLSSSITMDPLLRPDIGVDQRQLSPIIGLKSFNNWVKAVLISQFARPALLRRSLYEGRAESTSSMGETVGRVLDIGCGRGGDLQKWQRVRAREYVGLDVAKIAVNHARNRYFASVAARQGPHIDAMFVTLDCYKYKLSEALDPSVLDPLFDVVSMQFCMQNAFETEDKAKVMLENVSKWLRKDGAFVGTIPNDKILMSRLNALPLSEYSFGNSVYTVRFEDRERTPVFGHRYWMYVHDAVKFAPEYVAKWDTFLQLASNYNLELQYRAEFHEMYAEHCDHKVYGPLLRRMKVVDANGKSQMDEDQWDTANLYTAFAFKKL